jgi:phosphoglycerate dehydrogenase-like enzyme
MIALTTKEVGAAWADLPADLELRVCEPDPAAVDAALADDVEILVGETLPTENARAAGLRWVQLASAGTDQLIGHPLMRRDLLVSSAAGINAVPIAEFILARILYHTKELRAFEQFQRSHTWPEDRESLMNPALHGMRALLVGYGGIGRETARLLSTLGVWITAATASAERKPYDGFLPYAGTGDPDARLPESFVSTDQLHDALADADVVVLAVPLLPDTEHMIDAAALGRMKGTAILINVARGPIVDTEALVAALDRGQLAHAYLDVFEDEPLPADSPLWDHPRVSITPHVAGGMPDFAPKLRELFLENLGRYRSGQRLINQLDRETFVEADGREG